MSLMISGGIRLRALVTAALVLMHTSLATSDATEIGEPPRTRVNVVLIVLDDLGYGETAGTALGRVPTPHLEALLRDGVRCSQGYVTASFCSPSRAGLLTGRYQQRFGHEHNPVGKQNLDPRVGLPLSEKTLADRMKAAGYATGLIGKWHLGATEKYHPLSRGFDEFFGFLHEGHTYVPPPYRGVYTRSRNQEPPYDQDNPLLRGRTPVDEREYLTDAFTREATEFIERHRDEPFFLYLAYSAVHSPMQALLADVERVEEPPSAHRAIFAGMLMSADRGIGAVRAALHERGLSERTLLFVISDNGGATAELTSRNTPLAGGKGSLWEGGVRVPFVICWPGHLPQRQTYESPVSTLDVVPTALAAAGLQPADDGSLDGVDLAPFLTGARRQRPHDTLYWRMGAAAGLRHQDWKLLRERNQTWKLFDLASDPAEARDVAGDHPELVRDLSARYGQWEAQLAQALWPPPGRNK